MEKGNDKYVKKLAKRMPSSCCDDVYPPVLKFPAHKAFSVLHHPSKGARSEAEQHDPVDMEAFDGGLVSSLHRSQSC